MPRFRRPRSPVHRLRQVAAAVLACLALVLAVRPPEPATGAPPGQAREQVVVAAADLPAGTVLSATDLRTAQLPGDAVPDGAISELADLAGRVLAGPVRSGEPVTDVRLVGPGLWSAVPEGQVATPVRLADLAVATLLRAGDRVDVLAAAGDGAEPAVELVATGALVLAVPGAAEGEGSSTAESSGLLVLAVAPETAERLAAAGAAATLTVTLGRP